jgi:hypothetical protein
MVHRWSFNVLLSSSPIFLKRAGTVFVQQLQRLTDILARPDIRSGQNKVNQPHYFR